VMPMGEAPLDHWGTGVPPIERAEGAEDDARSSQFAHRGEVVTG
jgi:hypothetical protein